MDHPPPKQNGLMMQKNVFELAGKHAGQDIWVIAAGASMDHVDPAFFANKISIGVNQVYVKFETTYLVRKEKRLSEEAAQIGVPLIVSRYDCGTIAPHRLNEGGDYVFDHLTNEHTHVDLDVIDPACKRIVVSYSTITSAMHIAAMMGAANIIICGHDCGSLDGRVQISGYGGMLQDSNWAYLNWLREIEDQSVAVRDRLQAVYGCRIYSLNPFLNFGLEGHKYAR